MFFLCMDISLNRDLAELIFDQFAENPNIKEDSIQIELSEETRSHQECMITIQNLIGDARVCSQFFHEFYSQSDPLELVFIETDDSELAAAIGDFLSAAMDRELIFTEYPDARAAGLYLTSPPL